MVSHIGNILRLRNSSQAETLSLHNSHDVILPPLCRIPHSSPSLPLRFSVLPEPYRAPSNQNRRHGIINKPQMVPLFQHVSFPSRCQGLSRFRSPPFPSFSTALSYRLIVLRKLLITARASPPPSSTQPGTPLNLQTFTRTGSKLQSSYQCVRRDVLVSLLHKTLISNCR